jgi:hypothetical protein
MGKRSVPIIAGRCPTNLMSILYVVHHTTLSGNSLPYQNIRRPDARVIALRIRIVNVAEASLRAYTITKYLINEDLPVRESSNLWVSDTPLVLISPVFAG